MTTHQHQDTRSGQQPPRRPAMLRLFYAVLALLPWALSSCVLTMEDYTLIPEDERGIGQPYTYSDSLVTCTYEFNPGVTPLTDEAINYVAGAQDSTIFFLDNLPEKWLPKVGGYVSAGNSRKFPYGLGHRVTNVQHANGMYAVTLTQAKPDEIFKELTIKATLDAYEVPGLFINEETPDTLLDEDGNVVKIIYPDTTAANQAPERGGMRRFTRADAERTTLELSPSGHSLIDWRYVDSGNNPKRLATRKIEVEEGEAAKDDKTKKSEIEHNFSFTAGDLTANYSYKQESTTVITSSYEEDKKTKTTKQWSQAKSTETTTFSGGLQLGGDIEPGELLKKGTMAISPDTWRQLCEKTQKFKRIKEKVMRYNPDLKPIEIPFTIGVVPFCFVVRFEAGLSLTAGGSLNVTKTTTSSVWRTTVTDKNGKQTETKELISPEEVTETKASFTGSGGIEANLRIGVGVMGGIRGNGVGIDVGMGLKGAITYSSESAPISTLTEGISDSKITFEASWIVDLEVFVDVFGENIWNGREELYTKKFIDKTIHYSPRIDSKNTYSSHSYKYDGNNKGTVHHVRYVRFSQLWTGLFKPSGNIRPVLRVYKGPFEKYDYDDLTPHSCSWGKYTDYIATPDVGYRFEYDADPNIELHFVPALNCESNGKTYELRDEQVTMGEQKGEPIVEHIETYQQSVKERDDWTEDRNGTRYDTYRIADVVRLERTENIWEAGVYIDLVDSKGKTQFKKLKVKMLVANDVDGPITPGDYKFKLFFSIPTSGRMRKLFGVPVYPILTATPYAVIWRGSELGTEEKKCKPHQINLEYPFSNMHEYRGAIEVKP